MKDDSENGGFVEIYSARGETEAQLVKSVLESQGIPSLFRGESLRLFYPTPSHPLSQVKILVRPEDAGHAREILSQSETFSECPRCGALYVSGEEDCPYCT